MTITFGIKWTDQRVYRLQLLHGDGLSASQIAADLGGITRMAVLGKIHRLRLSRPQMPKLPAKPYRTAPAVLVRAARAATAPPALADQGRTPINWDAPAPNPAPSRKRLLDALATADCHWPSGDLKKGSLSFCGHRRHGNRPYCLSHCRIAYQRPKARREGRAA